MSRSEGFRSWLNVWFFINTIGCVVVLLTGALSLASSNKFTPESAILLGVGVSGAMTTGLLHAAGMMAATAADDLGRLVEMQEEFNRVIKQARG